MNAQHVYACATSTQISVRETSGSNLWEVEVPGDDGGKPTIWLDDDGLLTLIVTVQAIRTNSDGIAGFKSVFQKALQKYSVKVGAFAKTPNLSPELKNTLSSLSKASSDLLKQVKSQPLQKKHLDFFDKQIGSVLKHDSKDDKSHFIYGTKGGGENVQRTLPEFPPYKIFEMNAQGIFARGGCSYTVRFYPSSPVTDAPSAEFGGVGR